MIGFNFFAILKVLQDLIMAIKRSSVFKICDSKFKLFTRHFHLLIHYLNDCTVTLIIHHTTMNHWETVETIQSQQPFVFSSVFLRIMLKLCFTHYLCVVIIFSTQVNLSLHFLLIILGNQFCVFMCFMCFYVISFEFDIIFIELHHNVYSIYI